MTTTTTTPADILPPPTERYTVLGWLRKNLFSSWANTILTLVTLWLIYATVKPTLIWATTARWNVIPANLRILMVGTYPADQVWRIWICLLLLAITIGISWGVWVKGYQIIGMILVGIPLVLAVFPFTPLIRLQLVGLAVLGVLGAMLGRRYTSKLKRTTITLWLLYFPLIIFIIRGFSKESNFMPAVGTKDWGGLLLSLLLAVVGIVFSFPIGVALALGRRSKLPVIRTFSVFYIEFVRGVPLITILFMAQIMLPLLLPANMTLDRILRAMVGITLFSAAYLAENVRGGLQSISKGQFEAAHALGLSGFQSMFFIILPQALRAVIPILVGQFIGLLKDTTLVAIVGLFDLLGIANSVIANPKFIGTQREVYIFVAAIFWVFSYAMSYTSRRLELALGVGER